MCGILGIFSEEAVSGSIVRSALDEIRQRGPDDEGFVDLENSVSYAGEDTPEKLRRSSRDISWSSVDEISSCRWFGHRRLAIQGDCLSHQPMNFQDKWMVFEGEVYNKDELREELIDEGYSFNTDGDTEIILKAEDCWGLEKLSIKVRGMYTVAIYDESKHEMRLASDPLGKKPVYYHHSNSIFAFSSEIKPLLKLPGIEAKENLGKVIQYLRHSLVDNDRETFFQGIYRLQPGEIVTFDGDIERRKYTGIQEREDGVEKNLKESLKSRLDGEDVAVSISGGIDSAALSVVADDATDYYFASFPGSGFDESEEVAKIEQKTGIDVNKVEINPGDIVETLSSDIRSLEEPVVSPAAHSYLRLSDKARNDGNKIFVTGSGSDEIFSGYRRAMVYRMNYLIRKGKIRNLVRFSREFGRYLGFRQFVKLIGLFMPSGIRSYILQKSREKSWLETTSDSSLPDIHDKPGDFEERVRRSFLSGKIQSALRFGNKAVSENSMELRAAYMDRRLIESVIDAGEDCSFKNGKTKYPLRNMFRNELPDSVTRENRKIGYLPHVEGLLTDEDLSRFEELINSERFDSRDFIDSDEVVSRFNGSDLSFHDIYRIWSVEIWMREFID